MSDPRFLRPGFAFNLARLVEECGEVLAAAGKTQRWGALSVNPLLPPEQQETNLAWLLREMADLREQIDRLQIYAVEEFGSAALPIAGSEVQTTQPKAGAVGR